MGRPPTISKDRLIDTARRVFAAKGFDATTLADIAGELGVTPAAILRHVDSKQALFGLAMKSGMLLDPPQCILELPKIDAKSDPRVVLRAAHGANRASTKSPELVDAGSGPVPRSGVPRYVPSIATPPAGSAARRTSSTRLVGSPPSRKRRRP